MRVLILSSYFAPTNTIAAHRVTALARYLRDQSHDVKVIAARHDELPRDLAVELAGIEVIETRASPFGRHGNAREASADTSIKSQHSGHLGHPFKAAWPAQWLRGLAALVRHLAVWPDRHVGWLCTALPAALRLTRRWRPDIIYASSPPATCMALGALVSRRAGVPWVCEIRDRWADDPYYPRPRWRKAGERALERAMLASARGLVTVSETWARDYGARHGKPAIAVYSGFDPEVYRRASSQPKPGLPLRLVYTGSVYAGRDPTPLWRALAAMGAAANDIRVEFYGARRAEVLPGAAAHGVDQLVHVEEYVSHARAVELQCGADVLLLLQWDSPSEAGNIPGKLFEYIGAGRPILAIGYAEGEMARVVEESGAGLSSNEPDEIGGQLREWLLSKREASEDQNLAGVDRQKFARDCQYQKLEKLLSSG